MKRVLFLTTVVALCFWSNTFSQENKVCEKKMRQVDLFSITDVNKCLVRNSSVKKDNATMRKRVKNQLSMRVLTNRKTRANKLRYSTVRTQKPKSPKKTKKLVASTVATSTAVPNKTVERKKLPNEILFVLVDEVPLFENCKTQQGVKCFNAEMQKHFFDNFSYPKEAVKNNIQGRVFVKFIISKDGSVKNVQTYSTKGRELLEEEVKRIMKKLPVFFKPGKEIGEKIDVVYSMPIDFRLK